MPVCHRLTSIKTQQLCLVWCMATRKERKLLKLIWCLQCVVLPTSLCIPIIGHIFFLNAWGIWENMEYVVQNLQNKLAIHFQPISLDLAASELNWISLDKAVSVLKWIYTLLSCFQKKHCSTEWCSTNLYCACLILHNFYVIHLSFHYYCDTFSMFVWQHIHVTNLVDDDITVSQQFHIKAEMW